jgi:Putative 2OG-Fe(II) oxygenase
MNQTLNDPDDLHGLFPVAVQLVRQVVSIGDAGSLRRWLEGRVAQSNSRSGSLLHTGQITPGQHPVSDAIFSALLPRITEFGALLLGESKTWQIKEMWGNIMHNGGSQSLHNHANCIVSGIVYLTPTALVESRTVFVRAVGGQDYKFGNEHAGIFANPFNASRWIAPEAAPGDVLLFPSYLLHEVPAQHEKPRCTLAFNAIPTRLESWGYGLSLHP